MSRAIAILFFTAAVVYMTCALPQHGGPPSRNCPQNEEFTECGTQCEPSCTKPKSDICTLACVIGCQCKSGYLRNGNNQCVLSREC